MTVIVSLTTSKFHNPLSSVAEVQERSGISTLSTRSPSVHTFMLILPLFTQAEIWNVSTSNADPEWLLVSGGAVRQWTMVNAPPSVVQYFAAKSVSEIPKIGPEATSADATCDGRPRE